MTPEKFCTGFLLTGIAALASAGVHAQVEQIAAAKQMYVHDIYVMNSDGTNPVRLTDGLAKVRLPAWSPDGKHLAFSSDMDGSFDIWILSPDASEIRKLTGDPGADELGATWSADGKSIVFNSVWDKLGNSGLVSVQVDNGLLTDIPSEWGPLIDPDLANDGKSLVAIRPRSNTDIMFDLVTGSIGDQLRPVADLDTSAFLTAPKWDRGSRRVVVRASFASLGDIYAVDVLTGHSTPIVVSPYEERDPDWAPNSNQIVFASDRSGSLDIYTYDLDSARLVALTDTSDADEIEPVWSPDGRRIAYVSITADPPRRDDSQNVVSSVARAGRFLPEISIRPSVWKFGAVWHSRRSVGFVLLGRNGELIGGPDFHPSGDVLYTVPTRNGLELHHSGPKWDGIFASVDHGGEISVVTTPQREGIATLPRKTYPPWPRVSNEGTPRPLLKDDFVPPVEASSQETSVPANAIGWAIPLTGGQLYIPNQELTLPASILWLIRRDRSIEIIEGGADRNGLWAQVSADLVVTANQQSTWDGSQWIYVDEERRPTLPPPGIILSPTTSPQEIITVGRDGTLHIPGRAVE